MAAIRLDHHAGSRPGLPPPTFKTGRATGNRCRYAPRSRIAVRSTWRRSASSSARSDVAGIADEAEMNVDPARLDPLHIADLAQGPFDVGTIQTELAIVAVQRGQHPAVEIAVGRDAGPHAKQAANLQSGVPCQRADELNVVEPIDAELPNATRKCIFQQRGGFAASAEKHPVARNADVPASASSVSLLTSRSQPEVDERFHQAGGRICLEAVGMSAMGKHPSGCLAKTRQVAPGDRHGAHPHRRAKLLGDGAQIDTIEMKGAVGLARHKRIEVVGSIGRIMNQASLSSGIALTRVRERRKVYLRGLSKAPMTRTSAS